MTFSYRKATPADFDLTFHIKSYSIKPHVEMIWGWDEQTQLAFHRKEFDPEATQIILDGMDKPIGLLVTSETTESVYIRSVLIHQSAQRKGIGTAIITAVVRRAQSIEKRVELQVYKVNQQAKKLYERLGFAVTGQTELHYQMTHSCMTLKT